MEVTQFLCVVTIACTLIKGSQMTFDGFVVLFFNFFNYMFAPEVAGLQQDFKALNFICVHKHKLIGTYSQCMYYFTMQATIKYIYIFKLEH